MKRGLISILLVMVWGMTAMSQGEHKAVTITSDEGREFVDVEVPELHRLVDSLQNSLNLEAINVMPIDTSANRVIRGLDKELLHATLADMIQSLGMDYQLPNPLNSRDIYDALNAILLAAAEAPPSVQTLIADQIEDTLARLNGRVSDDGRRPLTHWGFKFGSDSTLSDSLHLAFSGVPLLDGDFMGYFDTSTVDTGGFYMQKPNLIPSNTYYYAAWAENESGIAHGDTLTFTTLPGVETQSATGISDVTGTLNAKITFGSMTPTSSGFRWGLLDDLSSANDSVVALSADSTISLDIAPQPNDEVYFVAYSTNNAGTRFGDTLSFVAVPDPCMGIEEVTYYDHTYPVVSVGGGCYFAENLKTTRYSSGTYLSDGISSTLVGSTSDGYHGAYDDDEANVAIYGRVYNAHAVLNPGGLCPQYWTVPSKEEIEALVEALGGTATTGESLKASASEDPAWDGSNSSGFSGLAGGYRANPVSFPLTNMEQFAGFNQWTGLDSKSRWWTRTATADAEKTYFFELESSSNAVAIDSTLKQFGHYVRCRLNPSAPEVSTQAATGVTSSEAILTGSIEDLGGLSVTSSGFVWGLTPDLEAATTVLSQDSSEVFQAVLSSLEMGTTVYYSAFATNGEGSTFGDTLSFDIDPFVPAVFETCGDLMAYDGYNYATVAIEDQCWFAENLRTTKFADQTLIPAGLSTSEWTTTSDPARSVLGEGDAGEVANLVRYGRLYNWHAVSTGLLCPSGWHVPDEEEWESLATKLGGEAIAGKKMKASSTAVPGWDGTDAVGFSALPGGDRLATTGDHSGGGYEGRWWSPSPDFSQMPTLTGSQYQLKTGEDSLLHRASNRMEGASVRCLLNARPYIRTQAATNIELTSATLNGEILAMGGGPVSEAGFIWGEQADLSDGTDLAVSQPIGTFAADLDALIAGTTYYYQAYATNDYGTSFGDTLNFTFTTECTGVQYFDEYYSAMTPSSYFGEIEENFGGDQCWMDKSLKTLVYNNGVAIPTGLTNAEWVNTTSGAAEPSGSPYYGYLYNWAAVETGMLCPSGWRVPTDDDWTQLVASLGGVNVAGEYLKGTDISRPYWDGSNYNQGFGPSGYRDGTDGVIYGAGPDSDDYNLPPDSALLWSSTANGTGEAWSYFLNRGSNGVKRRAENVKHGGVVRCIRGNILEGEVPTVATSTATDITGTAVTLNGDLASNGGQDITQIGFIWGASSDLSDASVVAGSDTTGAFSAALTGLTPGLTYYYLAYARNAIGNAYGDTLSFYAMDCESIDYNGHSYAAVAIGDQCWFAENLQTTTYNSGDAITSGLDNDTWAGTFNGATTVYAAGSSDEESNLASYGRLYNGFAATSGALCPTGWHVPWRAEWEALFAELGDGTLSGQTLKASPTDVPSWDGTNAVNFSAQPGGFRESDSGAFSDAGTLGAWWSATEGQSGEAWRVLLASGVDSAAGADAPLSSGLSVRCLQDSIILPSTISTLPATGVTEHAMVMHGRIEADGGEEASVVGFVWGLNEDLSDGVNLTGELTAQTDSFAANLTGLSEGTFYYYSAYATNSAGTTFGDTVRVYTMVCEPVVYQGYAYSVVPIGKDCWFAENLQAEAYNDGDSIPSGLSPLEWQLTTDAACTVLDEGGPNEALNLATYGRLYNAYTIIDERICPVGWHVSTQSEWEALVDDIVPPNATLSYQGRWLQAGRHLKASSEDESSWNGTNATDFSAVPGGFRVINGEFAYGGEDAFFWAQPSVFLGKEMEYYLSSVSDGLMVNPLPDSRGGRSIRCVKGDFTLVRQPSALTLPANDVRSSSAWLHGEVEFDGNADIVSRGFQWGENPSFDGGAELMSADTSTIFTAKLSGLVSGTTYYYRAFASNGELTGYGETRSFEHVPCEPVEFDGYTYAVEEYGSKCWFVENLRTAVYSNGDSVRSRLSNLSWAWNDGGASAIYGEDFSPVDTTGLMLDTLGLSQDSLQLYIDSLQFNKDSLQAISDSINLAKFGRLYNLEAVYTRPLCPTGWHVSSIWDWLDFLTEFTSEFFSQQATAMKASPSDEPSWDGENTSGFSALPGGERKWTGEFSQEFEDIWPGRLFDGEPVAHFWAPLTLDAGGFELIATYNVGYYFSVTGNATRIGVGPEGGVVAFGSTGYPNSAKSVRCVRNYNWVSSQLLLE